MDYQVYSKETDKYTDFVSNSPQISNDFKFISNISGDLSGKAILDIGCGDGTHLTYLFKTYNNTITRGFGFDYAKEAIEKANKKVIKGKTEFTTGNAIVPKVYGKGEYDFAYSTFCILVCCSNYEDLINFCKTFYINLKETGKGALVFCHFEKTSKITDKDEQKKIADIILKDIQYTHLVGPIEEFSSYSAKLYSDVKKDEYVEVHDYALYESTIIKALKEVGFKDVNIYDNSEYGLGSVYAESYLYFTK